MKAFLSCAAAVLLAALCGAPASAVTPVNSADGGLSAVTIVQFKWPWEAQQRRKSRTKRPARPAKPRAERPADRPAAKGERARKREAPAAAAPSRALDPKDALLPALLVPLALLPRGATARELEGWNAVAAQIAPPAAVPPLPPEGPAPAPANVMALLAALRVDGDADVPLRAPVAEAEDDDDGPDLHVPLPPVRPGPKLSAAPREGLAPESGLAPEGGGLAPETGLAPEGVPLPEPRDERRAALDPAAPLPPEAPEPPKGPTAPAIPLPVTTHDEDPACVTLADPTFAVAERIPPIEGPGVCGSGPLVLLTGVKRKDGGLIAVKPAATLRCAMAKELADYLRDDLAPAAEAAETKLERLEIAGSFMCRGRNGAAGGKMSEHGRANAVDLSGFDFSNGKAFGVFAADLPEPFKAAAKAGACAHFNTVLGPGSDGFHESHLHVDLQPRRSKTKLCQWSDPEIAKDENREDAASAKSGVWPKTIEERKGSEDPKPATSATADDDKTDRRAERREERRRGSDPADDGRPDPRRKADPSEDPLPKRDKTP